MLSIMLIFILVVYFGTISLKLKKYNSEKRTDKVTKLLSIIIKISPIVGIVIFSILFTFILKGRFLERVTHIHNLSYNLVRKSIVKNIQEVN